MHGPAPVVVVLIAGLLVAGCQPYHRHLHGRDPGLSGGSVDANTNARCSHISSMFRPDVVRSAQVSVPTIAGGSYYYSESYVRVTEPLLVTINQILLQACLQRELGEITAQEYTQIYRDNSARFIALARGFSAAPTVEAAAAAFDGGASTEDEGAVLTDEISATMEKMLRELEGTQEEIERLLNETRAQLADAQARLSATGSLASSHQVGQSNSSRLVLNNSNPPPETLHGLVVVFDTNDASIDQLDIERLARFARDNCCQSKYIVYGFADSRGTSEHNLALSRIRALKAADVLRRAAPEATTIEVALGESEAFGADMRDNRIVYVVAVRVHQGPGS